MTIGCFLIVGDISIDYTWIRYKSAPTNDAKKKKIKESTVMAAATVGAKPSKNQF